MALRNAERGEYHELLVVSSVATVVTVRMDYRSVAIRGSLVGRSTSLTCSGVGC